MTLASEIGSLLLTYGGVAMFCVAVLAAFGLPAPATLGLLLAGALAGRGQLSWAWMTSAGLAGAVLGDHLAYLLAARASARVHALPIARHFARAEALLDRWGIWQVFVSRWLFPTVLTPATNYFAGLSRYPLVRFTPAVVAGEAVYVIGYMALGAAFSNQIERVNRLAGRTSLVVFLVIALGVAMAVLFRRRKGATNVR